MKKFIGLMVMLTLITTSLLAQSIPFQFIIKVQDESGRALKGVNIENFHIRTADDGMAILNLPEGKTSLRLHLNGFIDQTVEVIASRLIKDNQSTFTLRAIPVEVKKIVVRGQVTTLSNTHKEPVPDTQVKLFYSGHELLTTSQIDGSFRFEVPDLKIGSYDWMIHYYHPDYQYSEPVRFTVPKTNVIELSSSLIRKGSLDSLTFHQAFFIIHPLIWKGDKWDVLDLNACQCVIKNEKGFQINVTHSLSGIQLKIVRRGYDDIELIKRADELRKTTSAEYVYMERTKDFPISRFNIKASLNYSLLNGGLFVTPFSQSYALLWHPVIPGVLKNRLAIVGGLSGKNLIETHNTYQTLSGFVGDVQSRYRLTEKGMIGLRYYQHDFRQRAPNLYCQAQLSILHQQPVDYFNEDNFTAERSAYTYVVPTLIAGVRKNFSSFLALEGSIFIAQANILSQSFTFNYFGNAYAHEDKNQIVSAGFNATLVFFIPR
jgi:hypothetical protein